LSFFIHLWLTGYSSVAFQHTCLHSILSVTNNNPWVCSNHFISGVKDNIPLFPAYVPSLTPRVLGSEEVKETCKGLNDCQRQREESLNTIAENRKQFV